MLILKCNVQNTDFKCDGICNINFFYYSYLKPTSRSTGATKTCLDYKALKPYHLVRIFTNCIEKISVY